MIKILIGIGAIELAYFAGLLQSHINFFITIGMMVVAGCVAGYLSARSNS